MGRTARSLGVSVGSVVATVAALLVVGAPLAAAKPAPPPTTAAPTNPPPSTAPATTATTSDAGSTGATTDDPGSAALIAVPPPGPSEPPPPQPNPHITVTPNTGLQDQQSVQIDATGYTPSTSVGAAQCRSGGSTISDCDLTHSVITTSDADGAWTATLIVTARIRVADGVIDCREKGACGIGAARISDYQEIAGASIAFDPNIEFPPAPVVTVDPARDLVHDQQVTVTGTGFAPGDHVYLQECADRGQYPVCAYDLVGPPPDLVADDAGTVSTAFTVKRFIGYPGELVLDCVDADCYVQVSSQLDPFATDRADLRFDPDGPTPPRPTASASPNRDLVHNQQITLTGSGFSPFEDVQISECSVDSHPFPVCAYGGIVEPAVPVDGPIFGPFVGPVDGDGNLSTTFTARRLIGSPGPGGTVVDCAEKPGCVLRVSSYQDILHSVDIPIAFDPDVPPPPPPTVTVTPNRDLIHDQVVTVSGSGFVAGDLIRVYECLEDDNGQQRFCSGSYGGGSDLVADDDGNLSASFTVKRVLGNPGEQNLDCTKDGDCALYAESYSDPFASTEVDLHFDPDAPLPPPPTLTVAPHDDLPWRWDAHVSGSGFAPNTTHNVVQCTKSSSFFTFQCNFGPTVQSDAQGSVQADITLRRFIDGGSGQVDCAPDACVVAVYSYDDPLSLGSVPLTFDPTAPPPPRPTLTVSPYDELAEGTTVTVEGAGFSPGAVIAVSQCKGEDTPALQCDGSILQGTTADANGRFSLQYAVHPGILVPDGIVGCYDAPGACSLRAAAAGLPDEVTGPVPLTFGAKAPPGLGGGSSEKAPPAVVGPATPVRTTSAPRLAFTGAPVAGYLEFAAIFLGLGTLLVLAGRRRRQHVGN